MHVERTGHRPGLTLFPMPIVVDFVRGAEVAGLSLVGFVCRADGSHYEAAFLDPDTLAIVTFSSIIGCGWKAQLSGAYA